VILVEIIVRGLGSVVILLVLGIVGVMYYASGDNKDYYSCCFLYIVHAHYFSVCSRVIEKSHGAK
jgi:hypothetical protein